MPKAPEKLNETLESIRFAAEKQSVHAYLYGKYVNLEKYLPDNVIKIILSYNDKFNTSNFYKALTKKITISHEIENTSNKYCVVSDKFVLDFELRDHFNPQSDYKEIALLTIDAVFYDLESHQNIDATGNGIEHINSGIFKSTINYDMWDIDVVLSFAEKAGFFNEYTIFKDDFKYLSSLFLFDLKPSTTYTISELITRILLTNFPANGIRFIINTFADGKEWVFTHLTTLVTSLNISLPEDINIEAIFSDKKLQLINIYNEFLLFEKTVAESPKERKKRLLTTLRLLLDSPTLSIETPYIDKVSMLSSSIFATDVSDKLDKNTNIFSSPSVTTGVSLFQEPVECPPYGCDRCFPEKCRPTCCCCSSLDIVSKIRVHCHKQIVLSCNAAGDGPGPAPCDPLVDGSCFPPGCTNCATACSFATSGLPSMCTQLTQQAWWPLPATSNPCDCFCRDGFETPSGCNLTCVECNHFCESSVKVTGHDCKYNFTLQPTAGCCGNPATIDWMFVIDISGSTASDRDRVAGQLDVLVDELSSQGIVKFAVVVFGGSVPDPHTLLDFTTNVTDTKAALRTPATGSTEWDMEAIFFGSQNILWQQSTAKFMMILADEPSQFRRQGQLDSLQKWFDAALIGLNNSNITLFVIDGGSGGDASPFRADLATATGGNIFTWDDPFETVVDSLNLNIFPASCDCLDFRDIPVVRALPNCTNCDPSDPNFIDCLNNLPESCFDFPIRICNLGQDCSDPSFCESPENIFICGNTLQVIPEQANLICCSDVGFGCDCPLDPCETECCGVGCQVDICDQFGQLLYPPGPEGLRSAVDDVWCGCWDETNQRISPLTPDCNNCCCPEPDSQIGNANYPCELLDPNDPIEKALLDNGTCCDCAVAFLNDCCNCCLMVSNGQGTLQTGCEFDTVCRASIEQEVSTKFAACGQGGITPPPAFECANLTCSDDEIISGEPSDCSATRHPSVVVLNNGVGLVAYEDMENIATIKIKQFHTSISNKLLPNREFNFSRLQNQIRWLNNTVKLYYYEPIPENLLTVPTTPVDPSDPSTWIDGIVFKNGPLAQQCFPILPPAGSDDIGDFIEFLVPTDVQLNTPFPSNDDIYNIKWLLFDFEDTGVIGCDPNIISNTYRCNNSGTPNFNFLIQQSQVDAELLLSPHIYNGEPVPIAFPSLATAKNYSDANENSHFVYLTYQALEDEKWNIYLRQFRLSEYQRDEQIAFQQPQIVTLSKLNIGQGIYRIICTNDSCETLGSEFLLKRSIVMEVLLEDGREVFNPSLTGDWGALCVGKSAHEFPREKVFVKFVHSVIGDRCPDQFGFDNIFYDWQVGQEYTVGFTTLTPQDLFALLAVGGDTAIDLGQFNPPINLGGVNITGSFVGAVWYDNINNVEWSVLSDSAKDALIDFEGFDISEPILLTEEEVGHSTRPVVKTNFKNEVYVSFESTELGLCQIKIIGTNSPSSSLPGGYLKGIDIDNTLNYFLKASDFVFRETITDEGINQSPDMFIDLNDVIHLTWQSNKDDYWEIYYATSIENFAITRLTRSESKSLRPTIDGTDEGSLFVTWHDDRNGNYEIFVAYSLATRVIPLFQQDPYLASFRHFNEGWSHTTDIIPINFTNNTSQPQCYQDFKVEFYEDRLLTNLSFSVTHKDFPFAFTLPDINSDELTTSYTSLSEWSLVQSFDVDEYGTSILNIEATSPETDTGLFDSTINKFTLPTLNETCILLTIEFRASNGSLSGTQWSTPVSITGQQGQTLDFSTLGLSITGRYQQVRITFTCQVFNSTFHILGANDDADRTRDGLWTTGGANIRFGFDTVEGTGGPEILPTYDAYLRYAINIPKSSQIVQAFLTLQSDDTFSGTSKTLIKLIDLDDTPPFQQAQTIVSSVDSSLSDTYTVNGSISVDAETDQKIRIGRQGSYIYTPYLRFLLDIPKDSVITSAHIDVYSETPVGPHNMESIIRVLNSKNVAEFPTRLSSVFPISTGIDDVHILFLDPPTFLIYEVHDNNNYLKLSANEIAQEFRDIFLRFDLSTLNNPNAFLDTFNRNMVGLNWNIVTGQPLIMNEMVMNQMFGWATLVYNTSIGSPNHVVSIEFKADRTPAGLGAKNAGIIYVRSSSNNLSGDLYKIEIEESVTNINPVTLTNVVRVIRQHLGISTIVQEVFTGPQYGSLIDPSTFRKCEVKIENQSDKVVITVTINGIPDNVDTFSQIFEDTSTDRVMSGSFVGFGVWAQSSIGSKTYGDNFRVDDLKPISRAILGINSTSPAPGGIITSVINHPDAPDFTPGLNGFLNYEGQWDTLVSRQPGVTPLYFGLVNIDVRDSLVTWASLFPGPWRHLGFRLQLAQDLLTKFFQAWPVQEAFLTVERDTDVFPSAIISPSIPWITSWFPNRIVSSPDISDLVTEWLNLQDPGYTAGHYIGLQIDDNNSGRSGAFASIEDPLFRPAAALTVTYNDLAPVVEVSSGVVWNPGSWSNGETINTSNIVQLIQSYIDRPGYSPNTGQYIGLVIKDNGSSETRMFTSFDSSPVDSAALNIFYTSSITWDFSMVSLGPPRLCLSAGDSAVGSLDITPVVRVDKKGNQTLSTPLPINYIPNNTYFVKTIAINSRGETVSFDSQLSVSCETCFEQTNTWNSVSCSVFISITNTSDENLFYNVIVKFYSDEERTQFITELNTFDDLQCFTIDNMIPASQKWTFKGKKLSTGARLDLLLWPQLSNTTGLICGITYHITIEVCTVNELATSTCNRANATEFLKEKWVCDCQSVRWNNRFEDAPVNIRELVLWRSSGFGFADTRITETLGSDNLNPIIKLRRNLNGVILYESNRKETPDQADSVFKIFASVFSVRPSFNMYSSSTQYIISPFDQIYHRSDIPICSDKGCFDNNDEPTNNPTLEGRTPSFDLDQFDSIFMAVEKPFDQSEECQELNKNTQQTIVVHRCGADAFNLFPEIEEVITPIPDICKPTELVENTMIESTNKIFNQIVKMIRVNNEDVAYHITRDKLASPVVKKCDIRFTVVGTPESVAIRLRNGTKDWSQWYPFEPEIGDYTIEIDWTLLPGSGVKPVSFQVSTYAGLAKSASTIIIADYTTVNHTIRFFKPIPSDTPLPGTPDVPDLSDGSPIWDDGNEAPSLSGVPVAAIRPLEIEHGATQEDPDTIIMHNSDYLFIEIQPDLKYLSQFEAGDNITPTFDFIQQGGADEFNIPTIEGTRDLQKVFRGKIVVEREGISSSKDGLSFIIPHFINDCSDTSSVIAPETPYIKDIHNIPIPGKAEKAENVDKQREDVWSSNRDEIGNIKHAIVMRPAEDPYLIFGDPRYRFKKH